MSATRWIVRVLLALVLAAAALRLGLLMTRFGRESLQADFAAFYTAGQAVRAGLSPYATHPDHDPPLWDGLGEYRASRFLYPPLFAVFMVPVTLLPYAVAKHLWMMASLGAVAAALVVLGRALRHRFSAEAILGLAAFVCLFQPLVTHLERGQVDAFTLLAVSAAVAPAVARDEDRVRSGLWLALGTLLKPNVAGLLPFLLLRRRWRAAAGWAIGGLTAAVLTVALYGGNGLASYVRDELPRIAAEGEAHGEQGRLDPDVEKRLRGGAPAGQTLREGHLYRIESFRFVTNASLVRPLKRRLGLRLALGRLALVTLGALVLLAAAWLRRHPHAFEPHRPVAELAYAQIAMTAVLLSWPVSWVMNAVWLLPAALIVLATPLRAAPGRQRAALAVCVLGLLLAAVPDALLPPVEAAWLGLKYVLASLLVGGSLVALLGAPAPAPVERAPVSPG